MKNGFGIHFYKETTEIYKGDWKNNNRDGKGQYIYLNGDIYEGSFKENLK
jgi:hypothetical protein